MKLTNVLKITLFALGGFLIVAKDFEGPDVPSEEVQERMYLRRCRMFTNVALLLRRLLRLSQHRSDREKGDVEKEGDFEQKDTVSSNGIAGKDEGLDQNTTTGTTITPTSTIDLNNNGSDRHHHDLLSRSYHFLKQLLKPYMVVIVLSFVVSLVDPLKALFIPPSSNFRPHFRPTAPDGQPPLAFIFDTATFIGEACVPLGLMCLGSVLACLSLRSGGPFPKGAIASLALGKMVVNPIIGVAITRGFAHVGFVDRDDKVLQFVCMCVVSTFSCH
jgi:predicted permease